MAQLPWGDSMLQMSRDAFDALDGAAPLDVLIARLALLSEADPDSDGGCVLVFFLAMHPCRLGNTPCRLGGVVLSGALVRLAPYVVALGCGV